MMHPQRQYGPPRPPGGGFPAWLIPVVLTGALLGFLYLTPSSRDRVPTRRPSRAPEAFQTTARPDSDASPPEAGSKSGAQGDAPAPPTTGTAASRPPRPAPIQVGAPSTHGPMRPIAGPKRPANSKPGAVTQGVDYDKNNSGRALRPTEQLNPGDVRIAPVGSQSQIPTGRGPADRPAGQPAAPSNHSGSGVAPGPANGPAPPGYSSPQPDAGAPKGY
jgi:hypothetical protein